MSSPGESLKVARSALSRPPSAARCAVPRTCTGPGVELQVADVAALVAAVEEGQRELAGATRGLLPAGNQPVDRGPRQVRLDAGAGLGVAAERQVDLHRAAGRSAATRR